MDEIIARIKTAKEARTFAQNAKTLGNVAAEAKALDRAMDLQAQEDGFVTAAQVAIARALYVYEAEQARAKGQKKYLAKRTRNMFRVHGPLLAAERMVLSPRPSQGYAVLTQAGLGSASFESIIDKYPEEFSAQAVLAARARLTGFKPQALISLETADIGASHVPPPALDPEALLFIQRFKDPENRFQMSWKPHYTETIALVREAIGGDRLAEIVDLIWSDKDNGVSNAGQGLLGQEAIDSLRPKFEALTREIAVDASPEKYQQVLLRLEEWRDEGLIIKLPRLLIGRAFAAIHPLIYHTLVVDDKQERVIEWLRAKTGFSPPEGNWAEKAVAVAQHLSQIEFFDDESLERNMFPWFVFEHLRDEDRVVPFRAGHKERPLAATAQLPAAQRRILLRHNKLQTYLYSLLCEQYGKDLVGTEHPTGSGGYADAVVRFSNASCFLYEVKVSLTAAGAVREAVGQLLEYAYRPTGLEPEKLFIVAEPPIDSVTAQFLQRMNAEFGLKFEYLQLTLPEDI
ncbi:hypothetical protein [Pseudomonas sp. PE-S1G-1]|uniref:hypothetical protein n=1 Tax=Pseudomonas sp. PE-S1G-1 TaxID=1986995 RepID=UPI000B4013C0|nr:hypothetical protein [Pseudomonas sp. PE-S1G-1]